MTEWLWLLIGLAVGAFATWLLARRVNAANATRLDALIAADEKSGKAMEKLRKENEATKDAAADAKRLRTELAAMRARLEEATGPLQARIDALQADVARRDRQILDYRTEIDEREHRMAALRDRLGPLDRPAAPEQDPRRDEAAAELARAQGRAAELEARAATEARRADEAVAKLARESADSLKHQARILELKDAVDHLTRRFAERNRELEAATTAVAERERMLAQARGEGRPASAAAPLDEKAANAKLVEAYRHDMAQRDRKIKDLERALAKARKTGRPEREAAQAPASAASVDRGAGEANGEAERGPSTPRPSAPPAAAPPETATRVTAAKGDGAAGTEAVALDDLTRIKGIGKVFEAKLRDAGIQSFGALAALDVAQIEAIVEPKAWQAIDFGQWIDQANQFGG